MANAISKIISSKIMGLIKNVEYQSVVRFYNAPPFKNNKYLYNDKVTETLFGEVNNA
jgi:hypothetical protein